jgi:hypothetical protein
MQTLLSLRWLQDTSWNCERQISHLWSVSSMNAFTTGGALLNAVIMLDAPKKRAITTTATRTIVVASVILDLTPA